MILGHSPANLLAAYLDAHAVTVPRPDGAAPVTYYGSLPAHTAAPVCLCVYDTSGRRDGRIMTNNGGSREGHSIYHPGYQIRSRAYSKQTAWVLITWAMQALDVLRRAGVEVDGEAYMLHAATASGSPLTMPTEPETNLEGYTTNGIVTITHTTTP